MESISKYSYVSMPPRGKRQVAVGDVKDAEANQRYRQDTHR